MFKTLKNIDDVTEKDLKNLKTYLTGYTFGKDIKFATDYEIKKLTVLQDKAAMLWNTGQKRKHNNLYKTQIKHLRNKVALRKDKEVK